MKVLFLCNKSPYPPREGGPLAMNANIRSLINAGHTVKVLALNTNKYFIDPNNIPEDYKKETGIELIYVDLAVKPLKALLNLFSGRSLHVERFISKEVEKVLIKTLESDAFDIVQLEMLYMTPYVDVIRKHSNARIILRAHNIEHLIWQRITEKTGNPVKRFYLKTLTSKLRKYELAHLNQYDGIAAITENDRDYFLSERCKIPLAVIPFGVDISEYKAGEDDYEFPSLFHIGSMNWMPNAEGIAWFVREAWPLIHAELPELKLYLAGRMMPVWLRNLSEPGIEVIGEVEDAQEFIRSKAVMVVPLFSGSGIRIKIIEGMALGKTIISTSVGAEGIHYQDSHNILIADTAEAFLEAVKKCSSDRSFCDNTGCYARHLIESEHSLKTVRQKLEDFYRQVLEK